MKNVMFSALLIASSNQIFSMDQNHGEKMRKNITQILAIYNDSLGELANTRLDDKQNMLEFLRIAETSKSLMEKYLPESTEKSMRIRGVTFAIDQIRKDSIGNR